MSRPLLILAFVYFSCANETETNSVLNDPPFKILTDSIRQIPQNADLYYRRGVLLYQNEEKTLAEADLKKAWELDQKESYALSLTTVLKEKNTDSAIAFIQKALQTLPNSIALQIGLARGFQQNGKTAKSIAVTDKVLEEFPGQLDALILKAELLKADNRSSESLATLEKAHSLVPSDPELAYDLAFEYASVKNDKVLSLTDSLIKGNAPAIEKAFYTRALYFGNTGNVPEAVRNFDAAIRANYNFLDAYRDKGELLFNHKKYKEGLETFELGLKVDPAVAEFYYWIGKIKEAQGNKEEAKLNYQKAYGLNKTMTEAKQAADKL